MGRLRDRWAVLGRGGLVIPRRGPERPARVVGRGLALASAIALVLTLTLVGPVLTKAPAAGAARPAKVPTIYHKSRSFRIPFNVDPADRPRLKEVQLWVSKDSGYNWEPVSRTTPDRPVFSFRASRDGEFWFAVRTLDTKGRLFPSEEEKAEPSMKVVVDTIPPLLSIESNGRRGSYASVRWDVKDEFLDPKSLVLEYQVEGGRDWRNLPIERFALIGRKDWDAGTAEPLKVRGTIADKAGNLTEAVISLSDGTPTNPGVVAGDPAEFSTLPPVSQISSGPTLASRDNAPRAPSPATDPFSTAPELPPSSSPPTGPESDPFGVSGTVSPPSTAFDPAANSATAPGSTQLVLSPKFPLNYAVDDAGPGGPAKVELWVTQDGGKSWFQKSDDQDRTSPFLVDLGGEGTFGLKLVSRSASGLGDTPPGAGEAPQMTIEVDSTPPTVQLLPPRVGTGTRLGQMQIIWKASDVHLAPKSATVSWRPEPASSRWQAIAEGREGNGEFIWTVPTNVPPRFHLRVDVVDEAGNRGFAETPEGSPVFLDRTRPRTRILGLDPSVRTGLRPGAGPVR